MIPAKVEEEFYQKIWDICCKVITKAKLHESVVPVLHMKASQNFEELKSSSSVVKASESSVSRAERFYKHIWGNPSMKPKIEEWAQKKRKCPEDGPPRGNDLHILAVALENSASGVELVTFDNDYLVFSELIVSTLNITVTDGFKLL
ncbi:MAG: hypothetical protein QXI12_09875 [Candidatus Methanomethyliaceae archaeon]